MNYEILGSFENDTIKIKDKLLLKRIITAVHKIEEAADLSGLSNIKKMEGSKTHYRMRVGDYRIGLEYSNNILHLVRFLHRKDIYKYFP